MATIDFINLWETYKLYAIATDQYHSFVEAFARKLDGDGARKVVYRNQGLHDEWMARNEPHVRQLCGEHFGTNPNLATHPLMRLILHKYGIKEAA